MKDFKRLSVAVVGLGLATAVLGSGVAQADPATPQPPFRTLQGEGSDTTENVMNALSEVVVDGSNNKLIASYDANGTSGFQTRSTGCTYTGNPTPASSYVEGARANGSTNGRKALADAVTAGKTTFGCLDFARSSSGSGTFGFSSTYIPFAKDALGFAVTNTSLFPRQLTYATLKAIYTCQFTGIDGTAGGGYKALIPQAGSGTRSFWLGVVGLTDDTNPTTGLGVTGSFPCVTDQTDYGTRGGSKPIQEHLANVVKNNAIVPVSVAQYIAQSEGTSADSRGRAILGAISDGAGTVSYPMSLNNTYGTVSTGTPTLNAPITRDVYNVVPTASITSGNPAFKQAAVDVFVGSTGLLCNQSAVIAKYGFGLLGSSCGSTTKTGS